MNASAQAPSSPTPLQLDALRELANIGCGHAANALSLLVGGRAVRIEVPRVHVQHASEVVEALGGNHVAVVSGEVQLSGGFAGSLMLLLSEESAHALCNRLLAGPMRGALNLNQRSAVAEVTNILASSCLNAVGSLTQLRVMPSVPSVQQATAGAVLAPMMGNALVLETRFATDDAPPVVGQLLLCPDLTSMGLLFARLGVE